MSSVTYIGVNVRIITSHKLLSKEIYCRKEKKYLCNHGREVLKSIESKIGEQMLITSVT